MSSENIVNSVIGNLRRELEQRDVGPEEISRIMGIAEDLVKRNPNRIRREFEDIGKGRFEIFGADLIGAVIAKTLIQLILDIAKFENRRPYYTDFVLALRDLRPHIFPWD